MGVPCRSSPMPIEASRRGGSLPYTAMTAGTASPFPAAVVQPQGGQRHTQALSCHIGMAFSCTCTPMSHVHARIGIDPR